MARNPYFKFQQFTVFHDKCAMKVGTDGTILGAWVDVENAREALDIGTGTGLISLMMAQKNPVLQIDAIDIESSAIEQAKENVSQSPFAERINLKQIALQELEISKQYDAIVSNPPYFTETLKSPDQKRAIARHADSLTPEELICFSASKLAKGGRLSMIYPFEYKDKLIEIGKEYGLSPSRITTLYPTPQSTPKRILIEFTKGESTLLEKNDLIIEIERHVYSAEFKQLVKDFYLRDIAKNI